MLTQSLANNDYYIFIKWNFLVLKIIYERALKMGLGQTVTIEERKG